MEKKSTHFGYQEVPLDEKVKKVGAVFDSVASKYDVMNDIMSMGIHRLWKRYTVEISGVKPGDQVLDLAGGTGDLTKRFSHIVGKSGRVVLSDINEAMLNEGRNRLIDEGVVGNVEYVQANAECLPFPPNSFDCITIGFGLRNVTNQQAALDSMFSCLRPGGRLLILEFSKPTNPILSKVYDLYSFNLLPAMGKLVANDAESYRYLAESIRMHPNQETLKGMMEKAGFERCEYINLTGGIVAIHRGYRF